MKILSPSITCILTTHMKPTLGEALKSVTEQTRRDAQVIVADSGAWHGGADRTSREIAYLYRTYKDHPMIEWVFTGERPGASLSTCMVAKVFNDVLASGMVRGRYLCTFYDDDLYLPTFFERMAGYLDEHQDCQAVRCSERWVTRDASGTERYLKTLAADRVLTPLDQFDCVVDGMQVMMRTEAVLKLTQPIIPEDVDSCRHSDGLFFERLKTVIPQMDALNEELCVHRFTPHSTFTPVS